MTISKYWEKETGPRLEGSRSLDSSKLQAPCITRIPHGGYRLFYTAVGPARPFPNCQGYILSAVSDDGLTFKTEPGIRLAPQPDVPHMSHRVLAPSVTMCDKGRWRMFFESRGAADQPTVICSAVSLDMLNWEFEEGIRLQGIDSLGGPRFLKFADGSGRLHCFAEKVDKNRSCKTTADIICADTSNGINFEMQTGFSFRQVQTEFDSMGITAAEVIAPTKVDEDYTMVYSEWQDVPAGTVVPLHPSNDPNADKKEFAAASIVADMSGYRSRIYTAYSHDGLVWNQSECIINGSGYGGQGLDAVHAEDMSLIEISEGVYRMYYAACDKNGKWTIASAITSACK
jgi:predicted GH43/DUF377 family glycosyl hydrolase